VSMKALVRVDADRRQSQSKGAALGADEYELESQRGRHSQRRGGETHFVLTVACRDEAHPFVNDSAFGVDALALRAEAGDRESCGLFKAGLECRRLRQCDSLLQRAVWVFRR